MTAVKDIKPVGITKQRKAVLQVISDSEGHLTANEVFEGARALLPGISFATVYNSLRYLRNEKLIGEVSFGSDAVRYDRKLTRHDHAVCSECGTLVDIELDIPARLIEKASSLSRFETDSVELILRGRCPQCIRST